MAGAIIPDDWDGSTYKCQKIEWPSSPQWTAILLGQTTEPAFASYWDADSGDVEDAAEAAAEAFDLTVPAIYEEDCDVENYPISAFKCGLIAPYTQPPGTFITIPWNFFEYEYNGPDFNLGASASHKVASVGRQGIWHYDLMVRVNIAGVFWAIRAINFTTGLVLARAEGVGSSLNCSFEYDWPVLSQEVRTQLYVASIGGPTVAIGHTFFDAHYVGPVVE